MTIDDGDRFMALHLGAGDRGDPGSGKSLAGVVPHGRRIEGLTIVDPLRDGGASGKAENGLHRQDDREQCIEWPSG